MRARWSSPGPSRRTMSMLPGTTTVCRVPCDRAGVICLLALCHLASMLRAPPPTTQRFAEAGPGLGHTRSTTRCHGVGDRAGCPGTSRRWCPRPTRRTGRAGPGTPGAGRAATARAAGDLDRLARVERDRLDRLGALVVEVPHRDVEDGPRPRRARIDLDLDRAAQQVHVTGDGPDRRRSGCMVRVQVVTSVSRCSPHSTFSQLFGLAGTGAEAVHHVRDGRRAVAQRVVGVAGTARQLDGRRQQHGLQRRQVRRRRRQPEQGADRSVPVPPSRL